MSSLQKLEFHVKEFPRCKMSALLVSRTLLIK